MNVLLVNPPPVSVKAWGDLYQAGGGSTAPLGLAYLAASLEHYGHHVRVIDGAVQPWYMNRLRSMLSETDFNLVGISVMTPMASSAFETAALVKSYKPDAKVVLGGPHVSSLPVESMNECPQADFIIVGEGEFSLISLIASLENNTERTEVPGLVFREDGEIKRIPDEGHIKNLDDIPMPAYHLFPMELYRPPVTKYRRLPTYSVITSRGCPFSCSFCCNVIHGKRLRQRSVGNVMQELTELKDRYGAKGIVFQDSSLCQSRQWVYDLCDALISSGINLEWSCLARVEQVEYQLLARMKQAGCWQISYGIESGNQRTLDYLRKNNTLGQIEAAVEAAHEAGIQVRATYMLAVPGETKEDIINTIRFAKKLGTMFASFQVTVPLPGSQLYDDSLGLIGERGKPLSWEEYNFFNKDMPFYVPEGMTREELTALCERAWISYYLSWRVITKHLRSIRSFSDIPKYTAGIVGLARMISSNVSSWIRQY